VDPHPEPDHADGVRVAARVLLVDPAGRVLLFQGFDPHDPARSFWFTAGGGLEPGESLSAGAIRELREETGMRVRPHDLVGPVWRRRARFRFEGVAYDSDEWFFLAALSEPPRAVDTGGFTELEARTVLGHRWWSAEELRRTHETVYPVQLAELLPGVLASAWDGHTRPID
jgi:8-oxo-dGTP pyrophosphatase MutT (NUDIX family)